MNNNFVKRISKDEKLIVFSIFLISCILKMIIVIPGDAPVMFFDEFLYKENAMYILNLDYMDNHYPPLYSLVLSLSFIKNSNKFYLTMQFINVILSSMLVFPTWLLSKKYLDNKDSIITPLVVSLIPYQFVYPRLIYSENMYYALIILLVYTTIRSSEDLRYIDSIIMGITISFCLMTRYMTYSLLPFIVIIWCVLSYITMKDKEFRIDRMIKELLCKGAIILISTIVISIPWLLLRYFKDYPLLEILDGDSLKYVTTSGLDYVPKWSILYVSYFILTMGPLLLPITYGIINYKNTINLNKDINKFIFAAVFITIPILFIAIKHSAMAQYNQEIPFYIIGRYVMYIFPIWLILSFVSIKNIFSRNINEKQTKVKIIISTIISIILIQLSYLTIIEGKFFDITNWFVMVHNAVDAYSFKGGGINFLVFTIILIIILAVFIIKRYNKLLNILLILFFIISSLISFNAIEKQQKGLLFNNSIANEIKANYKKVYISKNLVSQQDYYIKFWDLGDIIIEYDNEVNAENYSEIRNGDIILSPEKLPYKILFNYNSSYIYEYKEHKIIIDNVFPNSMRVGEKFNVQDSGKSALAIKGSGFLPGSYVKVNGIKIDTTYGNKESLSIIIDEKFYEKEGDLEIQVFYENVKSNKIIIPVR